MPALTSGCRVLCNSVVPSFTAEVATAKATLSQDESTKGTGIYRVNIQEVDDVPVHRFRDRIQEEEARLRDRWDLAKPGVDAWKECFKWRPFDENKMLHRAAKDAPLFCVFDEDGTGWPCDLHQLIMIDLVDSHP